MGVKHKFIAVAVQNQNHLKKMAWSFAKYEYVGLNENESK